jgi:mRNA-degrading endonuclease RelE of RelBE toxin-antitoxin system
MLNIEYKENLLKKISKVKDKSDKEKIKKQICKIIENPEIGKPMRYARKGTRELYIGSYRIAYSFIKNQNKIIFLDFYHKNKQ